uniref:G_PROTEIN_RECEP_F1_2 domain-containing protein n=1 Tax=Meloidogyne hapla TaxID=6305 RepID=A0A1I8B4A2_MELHA
MERALSLIRRHLVTRRIFGSLAILFMIIPICFAAPLLISGFPVSVFTYRYLCAIGSGSPVLYSLAQLLVYGGCLFVLLICFGSILKQKRIVRSLPVKPEHYGAFILENRILDEHMQLSRLLFWLVFEYAVIQGPYICLDFFVQIRNSIEVQHSFAQYTGSTISKDVDTLVTIIKLFHPLIVPTMILVSCNNIWAQLVDKICCRFNKSAVGASNSMAVGAHNPSFAQLLIGGNGNISHNNGDYLFGL